MMIERLLTNPNESWLRRHNGLVRKNSDMAEIKQRIAVLGAGNMGASLIGGILKAGLTTKERLVATTKSQEHAQQLADRFLISVKAGGNLAAVKDSEVIIVAVKPTAVAGLIEEVRPALRTGQILVSLAASLPLAVIEKHAGSPMAVFRAMPNIPVVVEEGATGISCNAIATQSDKDIVERIFRSVGIVCFVEEDMMDAVTALSGSGPAYIYMVIEALIAGGVKMGLSREVSTKLAEQTVLGAAKLVRETGLHPAVLRDQVITPGGVTISAIHELERHGLRAMLISAVETAAVHSRKKTRTLTTN
jgi:pyrroline-5-carboxylate reductase